MFNTHRVEGGWAYCQSATEDAPLPEQAAEPSVSNERTLNTGSRVTAVTVFVCVILSSVWQLLAGGADRSNGNLSREHNITVLQPQVSGFCCQSLCGTSVERNVVELQRKWQQSMFNVTSQTLRVTDTSCFKLGMWHWRETIFQSRATTFSSVKTVCELPSRYIRRQALIWHFQSWIPYQIPTIDAILVFHHSLLFHRLTVWKILLCSRQHQAWLKHCLYRNIKMDMDEVNCYLLLKW